MPPVSNGCSDNARASAPPVVSIGQGAYRKDWPKVDDNGSKPSSALHAFFDLKRCTNFEEWLEARKSFVTASNIASACGLNPYKSEFAYWQEWHGHVDPPDLSGVEAVEWGRRLEREIASAYHERTARPLTELPPFSFLVSLDYPGLAATPDRWTRDPRGPGVVQIKNVGLRQADEWVDDSPAHYRIQLQAEMAVTGATWGSLVALVGGQRLVFHDYERNERLIGALHARALRFMQQETAPEIDGSVSTAETLKLLYADDNAGEHELPLDAVAWHDRLGRIAEMERDLKAEKRELHNKIIAELAGKTHGTVNGRCLFTHTSQTRKEHTVAASTFKVLRRKGA